MSNPYPTKKYIAWLRELSANAGKGVAANVDGRALGRIADRIAELEAEPARLQEILLKQTKLNTRVINEKIELEATIEHIWEYSNQCAILRTEPTTAGLLKALADKTRGKANE